MTLNEWQNSNFEEKLIEIIKECYPDVYDIKIDKEEERVRIYFKSYSLKVASIVSDSKSAVVKDVIRCIEEGEWVFCEDYPQDVDWSRNIK